MTIEVGSALDEDGIRHCLVYIHHHFARLCDPNGRWLRVMGAVPKDVADEPLITCLLCISEGESWRP